MLAYTDTHTYYASIHGHTYIHRYAYIGEMEQGCTRSGNVSDQQALYYVSSKKKKLYWTRNSNIKSKYMNGISCPTSAETFDSAVFNTWWKIRIQKDQKSWYFPEKYCICNNHINIFIAMTH